MAVLLVYGFSLQSEYSTPTCRALAFITLILANLSLIISNSSWKRNFYQAIKESSGVLKAVVGGTLVFLLIVLFVPWFRDIFHFEPISYQDFLICSAVGVLSVAWLDIFKKKILVKS